MLHDTRRSHTGRDVLAFFRWIDMHVDPDPELQVILDNLAQPQSLDQYQLHLRRRTRNPDRLLGLPLERQPRALRLDQPADEILDKVAADKPPSTGSPNPRHITRSGVPEACLSPVRVPQGDLPAGTSTDPDSD
jgi:hypothetical protein